jgi:hypothetical protein
MGKCKVMELFEFLTMDTGLDHCLPIHMKSHRKFLKGLKGLVHEEKMIRLDVPSENGEGEKLG